MTVVDCLHKTAYQTKATAETALILAKSRDRVNPPRVVYQCRCGAWHLGHRRP